MAPDENATYSIVPDLWSQISNGTFIYLLVCMFGTIPLPILIAILCLIYNTSVYIIYMLIYWYYRQSAQFSYSWEAPFPTIFTCHHHTPVIKLGIRFTIWTTQNWPTTQTRRLTYDRPTSQPKNTIKCLTLDSARASRGNTQETWKAK